MKAKFAMVTLAASLLLFKTSYSQITLDTALYTYAGGIGYDFKLVNISKTETKWFFADTLNNTFSLYNMDFTPFLTNIQVPEPFISSGSAMQCLYITRTLFDCDSSNIEYAYYAPVDATKSFRVVRTDGTILLQVDSANAPFRIGATLGLSDAIRPIVNTSAGAKLFLQKFPLLNPIYVYSLCDSLPTDVFNFEVTEQSLVQLFPNPTSGLLTFQVNLPDNVNGYRLVILDNNGKMIQDEKVNPLNSRYSIDVKDFSSGMYYYSLHSENKSYQSGKFIINK